MYDSTVTLLRTIINCIIMKNITIVHELQQSVILHNLTSKSRIISSTVRSYYDGVLCLCNLIEQMKLFLCANL